MTSCAALYWFRVFLSKKKLATWDLFVSARGLETQSSLVKHYVKCSSEKCCMPQTKRRCWCLHYSTLMREPFKNGTLSDSEVRYTQFWRKLYSSNNAEKTWRGEESAVSEAQLRVYVRYSLWVRRTFVKVAHDGEALLTCALGWWWRCRVSIV